jgi:serine/threonine protein kinase
MFGQIISQTLGSHAPAHRVGGVVDVDRCIVRRLGKYEVGKLIGSGGMGTVYEAEDTFLKRKVAIKVLPDSLARNTDAIRKFVLEARAFARVNHPNAVQIFEVNRHAGVCYLVMELMPGSMQELLDADGALEWHLATQAVLEACRALIATHHANLIHRDIKPGNLMRSARGLVKLADFGLARDATLGQSVSSPDSGNKLVGTPHYMSPEQCRGERVDQRGDLYSLGATYYALLTGQPPLSWRTAPSGAIRTLLGRRARPAQRGPANPLRVCRHHPTVHGQGALRPLSKRHGNAGRAGTLSPGDLPADAPAVR